MKKALTRMLAMVLMLTMLLSLAACGKKTDEPAPTQVSAQATEATQATEAPETTAAAAADKTPITLTWGIRDIAVKEAGNLAEKSPIWKYVEDELGITVELVTYDIEKYNLLAAGGDMPDIVSLIVGGTPVTNIVSSGMLIPLDDLIAEHGENLTKNAGYAIKRVNSVFDATYVLPVGVESQSTVPSGGGYFGTFYGRYDVYKAIGAPEIKGMDGLLEVGKQMQEYERERTGRDDIYAFGNYFSNSYGCDFGIFMMGSEPLDGGIEYDLDSYEIKHRFLDETSTTWAFYEFMNKAYQMGIFDPDSLIMDGTEFGNKLENGQILFNMEWDYDINDGVAVPGYEKYGDFFLLPGSVEMNPFLFGRMSPIGYGFDSARAITTNCKYPERAMELLNWLDSTVGARALFSGLEGDSWSYVDGEPVFADAVFEARKNGQWSDYWLTHRLQGYGSNNMCSGMYCIVTDDGYPAVLAKSPDYLVQTASDASKAFAADYGCEYAGQVYAKWIEEGTLKTDSYSEEYEIVSVNAKSILLPDECAEIYQSMVNHMASNINKIILAKSDEEFDAAKAEMIQGFIDLGGQTLKDEVESQLNAMDWGSYGRK